MNRAVFLFALLAVASAEPPLRFRAARVQRPNARFARLEEQPPQPQQPAEEPASGYHYPKPMSSGYHYAKPDQPFPLPGEMSQTTEAAQTTETTTVTAEDATTTTAVPPEEEQEEATTTAAPEDYDEPEPNPAEAGDANAKLRRRQQAAPIRYTFGRQTVFRPQQQKQRVRQQPSAQLSQRLEQLNSVPVPAVTVDEALRPVYLINLPDSALQQLILLNSAQQLQLAQPAQPTTTTVLLADFDYIYKKK